MPEIKEILRSYAVFSVAIVPEIVYDGFDNEIFAEVLREATGLQVTLWDERRTTIDAHNILMAGGKNAKQRKKTVDAVAAALMLEGYLTRRRLEGTL